MSEENAPVQDQPGSVKSPFTVLDLFCGPGGLSFGFVQAGFVPILALDKNRAAVETYRANVGAEAIVADLTAEVDFPRTTVVVGGPPCQGFSSAGVRRPGDERNSLVARFAHIVANLKPAAFVFENVEGFLTGEDGAHVLDLLLPLMAAGYRMHVRKINAANYGVPQHRKRVIVIGGFGWEPSFPSPTHTAWGAPGAYLAARTLPATATVMDALKGLPAPATSPPGYPTDHFHRALTGIDLDRAQALKPGQRMRDLPEALWHESYRRRAYRRVMDGTPTERRGGAPAGLLRLRPDQPSKAITSGARTEFLHPVEDRNLTLRECARLQTFPDGFIFSGTVAERTQLIGDAVPPVLACAVARSLVDDLTTARPKAGEGRLLSFVPTLSEGASPKLAQVMELVTSTFSAGAGEAEIGEQLALWR